MVVSKFIQSVALIGYPANQVGNGALKVEEKWGLQVGKLPIQRKTKATVQTLFVTFQLLFVWHGLSSWAA